MGIINNCKEEQSLFTDSLSLTVFWLVGFYGISILVGYLMPNHIYIYIYIYMIGK